MRSLDATLRREIRVLSLVSAVLMLSLLGLGLFAVQNRVAAQAIRGRLAEVNELVGAVLSYRAAPSDSALEEIEAASATLLQGDTSSILAPTLTSLLEDPAGSLERVGALAFQEEVVAAARRMNRDYLHRETTLLRLFSIYTGAILVMSVIFVLSRIRGRRQYSRLVENARSLMQQVSELLRYERESINHEPTWAEENLLYAAAKEIEASVRDDRETASQFVYGNLESFMPRLKKRVERLMPCDRLAVAFLDGEGQVVAESAALEYGVAHLEPGFREAIGDTTLGAVSRTGHPRIIGDLEKHYAEVHQSTGTQRILEEGMRSSLTFPITIRDRCVGFLFASSKMKDAYSPVHISRGERILNLLKQHLYFHYVVQQIVAATSNAFVTLMERKDNETSRHIIRMSRYSYIIGRRLNGKDQEITPTLLREILWFAPLHDIGKVGIPDAILLKPGALEHDERKAIEEHVSIGVDVIKEMDKEINRILSLSLLSTALDIISGHHEKYDGTGYPIGLSGEDIPLAGRITAVADVFDALTSRRPYKEALSIEDALDIMRKARGNHFDPVVFDAFVEALDEIREVYETYKEV